MSDKEKPRQRRSHGDTWLPSGGIVATRSAQRMSLLEALTMTMGIVFVMR
jgi:hypothetical protein